MKRTQPAGYQTLLSVEGDAKTVKGSKKGYLRCTRGHGCGTNMTRLDLLRDSYAHWLVRCADTVTLLTCEEVAAVMERARSGAFDADLPEYLELARAQKSQFG